MELNKLIADLQSPDAETRYNAVVKIARMPAHDDWVLAYDAIDTLLTMGEPDEHVGSAAAIALSMLSARNFPGGMLYGHPIPDFLPDTYARAQVGLCNQPSPQDFDDLYRRMDSLPGVDEPEDDDPTS